MAGIAAAVLMPLLLLVAVALGMWLKKHPGHPALEELDAMLLQEARNVKLAEVARALTRAGVTLPVVLDPVAGQVVAQQPAAQPAVPPPPLPVVATANGK